ncbi:MAG: RND transporter [Paracoccaceae bacterium]|nr:RND transporter [Paracoccaceae bacterium]
MNLSMRLIVSLGLLAAVVGGLFYVSIRVEPVAVDIHTLARGPMQITVNADGKTEIREVYEVAAPISGTAQRAPVHVGDRVVGGETVVAIVEPAAPALLDTRTRIQAEAALREAEGALHVAESDVTKAGEDMTYARTQFERAERLVNTGAASLTRLEDAEQRLNIALAAQASAQSRLEMAQGSVDRARAALIDPAEATAGDDTCCVQVLAPADGVVLEVFLESELPVIAGTKLLSIGDAGDLQIIADLLSSDAVRLPEGALAEVDRWGGPVLEARLRAVEPAARTKLSALGIEEQRVDAVFDLVSAPEARPGLGHGFAVFLRIVEWQAEDVLPVPLSAVFRQGQGWAVYVDEGGFASLRQVELGKRNGRVAEVLDGLTAGERVIEYPSDQVSDGSPVIERTITE